MQVPEQVTAPFAQIADYYDGLVRKYGHDPRACDYGRPESQQIKFRVLSEVMPLNNSTLLDVGCGFADFAGFLRERFEGLRYSGIDLCAAMINEAQRLHPDLEVKVANLADVSFNRTFDVVTANGIFYLLGEQAWPTMQSMIERMFTLATRAVAFNSLSAWSSDQQAGEFYADPLQTVQFCRELTPWVVLRHDYHPRDFTIYLYKTART
jgi:cyclopropane fatty-acyl-phospholipid synthase-like methyltransferase